MAATNGFIGTTRKVTAHLTQNEGLSFEKSSPGKKGYKLASLDVPESRRCSAAWAMQCARMSRRCRS